MSGTVEYQCPICDKIWLWDACQDYVIGAECVITIGITQYLCTCKGTICVVIEDQHGEHVYMADTRPI